MFWNKLKIHSAKIFYCICICSLITILGTSSSASQVTTKPNVNIDSQRRLSSEDESFFFYFFGRYLEIDRTRVEESINSYMNIGFDINKQDSKKYKYRKTSINNYIDKYEIINKNNEIQKFSLYIFDHANKVIGYCIFEYTRIENLALISQVKNMQHNLDYLSDISLKSGDYEFTFYEEKHNGFVERYGIHSFENGTYQDVILDAFYPEELEPEIQPIIREAVKNYLKQ